MHKIYKNPYLILSGCLVLGMIVYIFLTNYNADVAEKEAESSEAALIYLTDYESLASFSYSDGVDSLSFEKKDDAWTDTTVPSVTLSDSTLTVTEQAIAQLMANQELTEDLDELSAYGLETPAYTISFTTEDGESGEILIGNTLSDGSYYAKLADSDTVYVIDSTIISYLTFDVNTLVATPDVPTLDSDTVTAVQQIIDGTTIELTSENDETTDSTETSESSTTESTETETSSSSEELSTPFTDALSYLSTLYISSSINYQPTAEELSSYGLDEASRTTYQVSYEADGEEQTFTLNIGNLDSDSGYYYVEVPANQVVYQLSQATVEGLAQAFTE